MTHEPKLTWTVELRDAEGHVIDRLVPAAPGLPMPSYEDMSFPYLRLVDPYGDTVFSGYQMSAVIPELQRLARAAPSPNLDRLLELAQMCDSGVHVFLVFIGD